ncbi:DUF4007 family protein [uncultured Lamprocystis sp.]|jgi:hypothetical protein|uniref:DUF4007 family protein n=1 Tax=uncultured Lamprocystis sp. TaxID=543132 RepID=UPI0025F1DD9B|nr:DUF4007 family protein [uncultured Lamprocystis sp.]
MALIDTQTFPLTKQRLITALAFIPNEPDVFSSSNMRKTRVAFISGKNVLSSIRGWLLAASVITNDRSQYYLTDYGKRLFANDSRMEKAASWWSFHLSICFSERCEPYRALFYVVGESGGYVIQDDTLISKIAAILDDHSGLGAANASIETNLSGVLKMFMGDSPLSDLGLFDILEEDNKRRLRLAEPSVPDQAIVHALALARQKHFPTRVTVHFSELIELGFHHFLCLPLSTLRKRLRELCKSSVWQQHLEFLEGQDLDSIRFGDRLNANQTLLNLLQESEDTWI